MSLYSTQDHIQAISDANKAISIIGELLLEFQVDSECESQIPEPIKNGRVVDGLLAALQIATRASDASAQWLEEKMHHMNAEQTEILP